MWALAAASATLGSFLHVYFANFSWDVTACDTACMKCDLWIKPRWKQMLLLTYFEVA